MGHAFSKIPPLWGWDGGGGWSLTKQCHKWSLSGSPTKYRYISNWGQSRCMPRLQDRPLLHLRRSYVLGASKENLTYLPSPSSSTDYESPSPFLYPSPLICLTHSGQTGLPQAEFREGNVPVLLPPTSQPNPLYSSPNPRCPMPHLNELPRLTKSQRSHHCYLDSRC